MSKKLSDLHTYYNNNKQENRLVDKIVLPTIASKDAYLKRK